jgi:putative FmdB family regulatory protein
MPTYGYHCGRCGHEFEVRQSMADAPLTDCPECGGELRKLLYPVGVQFKGSGFYSTDYRRGGEGDKSSDKSSDKASDKTPDKTSKTASGQGSEGKSESGSAGTSDGSETKTSSGGSSGSSEKKTEPAANKE